MIISRYIWPSMLWILIWVILMGNTPVESFGMTTIQEVPPPPTQPRPINLGIFKDAALIGGICSIITATIWAFGLTTAARYKHLGRK